MHHEPKHPKLLRAALLVAPLFLFTSLACARGSAATAQDEPSIEQKASYAIGFNVGKNLRNDQIEADLEMIMQGIEHGFEGKEPMISQEVLQQAMQELQEKVMAARQATQGQQGEKNREQGAAYLAENGKREGVETTASGLQYEVVTAGEGPKPAATDRVSVHYRGTTIDGVQFDSSYDRGQPATFGVGQVIGGWTEALQLMTVGSKWKLAIPSTLAYGPNPPPGAAFGPDATLLFEVELLGIE